MQLVYAYVFSTVSINRSLQSVRLSVEPSSNIDWLQILSYVGIHPRKCPRRCAQSNPISPPDSNTEIQNYPTNIIHKFMQTQRTKFIARRVWNDADRKITCCWAGLLYLIYIFPYGYLTLSYSNPAKDIEYA